MSRLNWNRRRRVFTPWYADLERDILPAPPKRTASTRKLSSAKPKARPQRHEVKRPDDEDAFFALLATKVDVFDDSRTFDGDRVRRAKAALVGARTAVVHTDGSCQPNPGVGGWGLIIDVEGRQTRLWGGEKHTTNNRMELIAAIVALTVLPTSCSISIRTDSSYLVTGATQWLAGWKRKGFRRGDGLVTNHDLWKELDRLSVGRAVRWIWVRGHNGDAGNHAADELASRGRRECAI